MSTENKLIEIAKVFFKLGAFAFGGPAAHIAMMEDEIVRKRKWMTEAYFLDLMGATNLIPGPNSTEMTMHCGYERGGWKGMVVAGFCFIFPAVVLTSILAHFYKEYAQLPQIEAFIYGIKPAVIALILHAGFKLGKKAFKNSTLIMLFVFALALYLIGFSEILIFVIVGIIALLIDYFRTKDLTASVLLFPFLFSGQLQETTLTSTKLFFIFLKIGAILYGSGYVLFAFLESNLVEQGWLTNQQLLDAVAVGQFTPGPVLSTATFIGWQVDGLSGAIAATVGIFLPSFIFVAILNPLIAKVTKINWLRIVLDAVNVAAVALIFGVCIHMAKEAMYDWRTILIGVLSAFFIFYLKKVNSIYIVLGGAVLGYILSY